MILVTGGAFQGKTEYVMRTFGLTEEEIADGRVCAFEDIHTVRCINHFHEYVRRMLEEGLDTGMLAEQLKESNPGIIVISNELGSGVIPIDAFDREWREKTGRLCCDLAAEAAKVYRVVCGIGTVIKG